MVLGVNFGEGSRHDMLGFGRRFLEVEDLLLFLLGCQLFLNALEADEGLE